MQNQNPVIDTSEQARQIVHLLDEYDGLSHWADPADSLRIQRCRDERFELRSRLLPLASRRSYLAGEWNRLAEEVDGCQRALELIDTLCVDGDATPPASSGSRIRRRLEVRAAEAVDFKGDLTLVDERIADVNVAIMSTQSKLIAALEQAVGVAKSERVARTTSVAAARQNRMRELMDSDPAVMWSPSPVIGYRVWTLKGSGFIGSHSPWSTSAFTATCGLGDGVPHTDGRCADVAFGCGVYAAKDLRELLCQFDVLKRMNVAVGLVILTGKVVEHEIGYRAETAQVVSLAFLDSRWLTFVEGANGVAGAFSSRGDTLKAVGYQERRPTGEHHIEEMLVRFFDEQAKETATWTLATNRE